MLYQALRSLRPLRPIVARARQFCSPRHPPNRGLPSSKSQTNKDTNADTNADSKNADIIKVGLGFVNDMDFSQPTLVPFTRIEELNMISTRKIHEHSSMATIRGEDIWANWVDYPNGEKSAHYTLKIYPQHWTRFVDMPLNLQMFGNAFERVLENRFELFGDIKNIRVESKCESGGGLEINFDIKLWQNGMAAFEEARNVRNGIHDELVATIDELNSILEDEDYEYYEDEH
ncbi:hypothetical protein BC938DRAFT_471192 [Jimgerdemannia flammicorona]|uniref:Uncharacterized protein n=1 Tax=Jimgerdemannia flammicorona TaxID=994334 RepID=A0A433Q8P9_9FUNG|nr:hypothetical protein BC938DRAFT_471192 [Jimgerdemannia flammicorona]